MFNSVVTALGLFAATTTALPVRQGGDLYYEGSAWTDKGVSAAVHSDTHDHYFEQRVDHFDRENPNTFQQRYESELFGVIILFLCGLIIPVVLS